MWEEVVPEAEPSPSPAVLVAVVPSVADWERIRAERWYRIPVRHAPARIGSEYLALYLPGCFGEQRWSIRTYAAIRRYVLATRAELLPAEPDHPRAGELYYRLELGPLQTLPRPVLSTRLRRVTFIHTDLATLFQAHEVADLWHRESPRERLWRGVRLAEWEPAYGSVPVAA
jgi:hypothetical protein